MTPAPSSESSGRCRCLLTCLVLAAVAESGRSYSYSPPPARARGGARSSSRLSAWEDDFSSSRNDADVSGDKATIKPAWQENAEYWADRAALEKLNKGKKRPQTFGKPVGGIYNDGGNTFAHMYQKKSTDDFKKPYEDQEDEEEDYYDAEVIAPASLPPTQNGAAASIAGDDSVPDWFGGNARIGDDEFRNKKLPTTTKVSPQKGGFLPEERKGSHQQPPVINASMNPNVSRHSFQSTSTDDFKRPHGMPGASVQQQYQPPREQREAPPQKGGFLPEERTGSHQQPPVSPTSMNPNIERHSFQTTSTDDFKRPHGMPGASVQQQFQPPREQREEVKAAFQTSSTDDFRRSSDVSSGVAAPQQPLYQTLSALTNSNDNQRSEAEAWKNSVGQDVYGSTQLPPAQQQQQQQHPNPNHRAAIVHQHQPTFSQSSAPMTDFEQGSPTETQRRSATSNSNSKMMVGGIQWPVHDPPGVASEYPLLLPRVLAIMVATLSTWYLHLHCGHSPVLASSVVTFLVSTCVDRRLGQAALCGSLAGMSGNVILAASSSGSGASMAMLLGGLTCACYEVLIRINNLCLGIGGRLGATAFLATSIFAKWQGIGGVGRKMRRGLWKAGAGPSSLAVSMILFHMLGSVATVLLRESSNNDADAAAMADPVRASSVVGMLGSFFLGGNPMAVLALYGGSFVGMSLPSRLIHGNSAASTRPQSAASLVTSFAGAGAIAGLIHATSMHLGYWNGGWGGKFGLCAFAGCWVYRGIGNAAEFVKRRA